MSSNSLLGSFASKLFRTTPTGLANGDDDALPNYFDGETDTDSSAPVDSLSSFGYLDLITHPLATEAASPSAPSSLDSATVTLQGSGLVFNNTYGSGVTTAFKNDILAAENYYQSHFTNNVTINCTFDLKSLGPGASAESGGNSVDVSYSALVAALQAHATTTPDFASVVSLDNLTDPSKGAGFKIAMGEALALGLAPAGAQADESITLNSDLWTAAALQDDPDDAAGTLEHELSEGAMGRIGSLGAHPAPYWAPMDLFRFTASGQRDFTGGADGLETYFSTNGDFVATGLQYHPSLATGTYDGSDLADWDQVGDDALGIDPFGPGGPGGGDAGVLSATDLEIMNVLGWTPVTDPLSVAFTSANFANASDVMLSGTVADNVAINGVEIYEGLTNLGAATINSATGAWNFSVSLFLGTTTVLEALSTDTAGRAVVATLYATTGSGNTIDFKDATGDQANLYNTGSGYDVVTGWFGNIYLADADAAVTGGGDSIYFTAGVGEAVSLYDTLQLWDSVDGANETIYLFSAHASVVGGNDTVHFAGGSGDATSFYNTGSNSDSVMGSNGTVYLTNAQATVIGGADTMNLEGASGNMLSLDTTAGAWDLVNGSGGTISLTNAQSAVAGGGNVVNFSGGSGNATSLYTTGGKWDEVNGSSGAVYLTSAQASIVGGGDTVVFEGGSGNAASLYNTNGNWDLVTGSNGTVYLNSAQAVVTGGGDTVNFASGSGNAVTLSNTGGDFDLVNASGATIYLTGAQSAVVGGGDNMQFVSGSGDAVSLYSTAGKWDSVTGSGGTVYMNNAQAGVAGNSDTFNFSGANSLTASGSSDTFVFQAAIGVDTLYGFSASDSMRFSASDFANWPAFQTHVSQSGGNTLISLDASDSVTLVGVTASSLTSSQFQFV